MKKKGFAERTQSHDWAASIPGVRTLQRIGSRRRHDSTSALSHKKNSRIAEKEHHSAAIPVNHNATRVARINSIKECSSHEISSTSCPLVTMKDDSRFQKYWNMKLLGIPDSAILNDIRKDGYETSIWYLDWNKNYEEQQQPKQQQQQTTTRRKQQQQSQSRERQPKDSPRSSSSKRDGAAPPLVAKKHSRLEKYSNMKIVGLSEDDIDRSAITCLDGGQDDSSTTVCDDFPIMKDDPRFDKYWKMKVVGVPDGAVRNAIRRDGQNEQIWDLDWDKNYESQVSKLQQSRIMHAVTANESRMQRQLAVKKCRSTTTPIMKDDSRFQKYWKMNSIGVPHGAILNAIARDGLDTSIWNMDWDENYEEQLAKPKTTIPLKKKRSAIRPIPMKKDSRFDKYWKMKAVGVPSGAIQNAMRRDGWDASVLFDKRAWDKNYETQLLSSQTKEEDTGIWGLKASMSGISTQSTRSTGRSGWLNPWSCTAPANDGGVRRKDPTIRRKKIFWRPIDPRHIKENSLWSLVQSRSISLLSFDSMEFNELFTEPIVANANQQQRSKSIIASVADVKPKPKRAVQVIDVKRSMNGGIVLARLRLEYEKIATIIGNMYVVSCLCV
jgi:Subunit CCDC53 of WASH complex